jgi:hypothetical protein
VSVQKKFNKAVSNNGEQIPPEGIGIDRFEFWVPGRRPDGRNLALHIDPALPAYDVEHLRNGFTKPWIRSNAWVADPLDEQPSVYLKWDQPQKIRSISLYFDTDYDHAMETTQWGHPENVMPHCVRNFRILDDQGRNVHSCNGNHQSVHRIEFEETVVTKSLEIQLDHPSAHVPASLFEVRCYSE